MLTETRHLHITVTHCGLNSRYVTIPSPQDMDRQQAKSLGKLNIDEVCQWFMEIGLHKCLPFIRGIECSLPPAVSFPRFDEDSDLYGHQQQLHVS